jgi:hypothetical protein
MLGLLLSSPTGVADVCLHGYIMTPSPEYAMVYVCITCRHRQVPGWTQPVLGAHAAVQLWVPVSLLSCSRQVPIE